MARGGEKSEAYLNGWLAHMKDAPDDANPYDETLQAKSYRAWDSGWCERFGAVKHGRELIHDSAEWSD